MLNVKNKTIKETTFYMIHICGSWGRNEEAEQSMQKWSALGQWKDAQEKNEYKITKNIGNAGTLSV